MANKLAGQKAKFTKALLDWQKTEDEGKRQNAARRMAEVIAEAPRSGFAEAEVTQGEEVAARVRELLQNGAVSPEPSPDDPELLVRQLQQTVDTCNSRETGRGAQFVYAYGYRCAPDRLKIGRSDGDVVKRIASQINTGTPDKPALSLVIRTEDCRALEKTIHGVLEFRKRKVAGGGDEWYLVTRDELIQIYKAIASL
jgi:hypothetical protein